MKRKEKNEAMKTLTTTYATLPLFEAKNFKAEKKSEKCTRYHMGEGVSMDICDGEVYDFGSICVYGLCVQITIRESKKGDLFISYPQVKNKAGEYKALVTNYSKALIDAIKIVLKMHYDNFVAVDEDVELPFE